MGDTLLDVNGVKALAELPSLDELRAKIVGLVQAPATKIVQIVQAPAGQLARVFSAYATKDSRGGLTAVALTLPEHMGPTRPDMENYHG